MKKLIFLPLFKLVLSITIYAQDNNPYDSKGIKVKESVVYILNEIKSGKIKNYDQETLNEYSKVLAMETRISVEMVAEIYKAFNDRDFNLAAKLNTSDFSSEFNRLNIEIYDGAKSMNKKTFQGFLKSKVLEIQNSGLSDLEKENLLTMCSMIYHLSSLDGTTIDGSSIALDSESQNYARNGICTVSADGQTNQIPCGVAGAIIGATIGHTICGLWCGIGGGVIGFIVGVALK